MALAFDRSSLFALDKPAGQACPNLDKCGACTIHDTRAERGYGGCIAFDCQGAGQRTTALFAARGSWMQDPLLIEPISRAFGQLLRVHEHLSLLEVAETLNLSRAEREVLAGLRTALEEAGIDGGAIAAAQSRIDAFLIGLKGHVSDGALARR